MEAAGQFYRIFIENPTHVPHDFYGNCEIEIDATKLCPFCGSTEVINQVKIPGYHQHPKRRFRRYIQVWVCTAHNKRWLYFHDDPKKQKLIFEFFPNQSIIHIHETRNDWLALFSANNAVVSMIPNQSPFNPNSVPAMRVFLCLIPLSLISLFLLMASVGLKNLILIYICMVIFVASWVIFMGTAIYLGMKMPFLRARYYFGSDIRVNTLPTTKNSTKITPRL